MNYKITNALLFGAGVVVGSVATWKFVKTKYERLAQEEIESVKEAFAKNRGYSGAQDSDEAAKIQNECVEDEEEDPQDHMQQLYEYEAEIRRLGYASAVTQEEGGGEPVYLAPYVISPDEFGEEGYDTAMLSYYADGVLEDDYWNVIDDVEDVIGTDFKGHFGEYANDTVFVRNEKLHIDYEVTQDKRTHAESQMYSPRVVSDDV